MRHLSRKHPTQIDEKYIETLPVNATIEMWVDKVLDVQGKLIKKTENEVFSITDDDEEALEPEQEEVVVEPPPQIPVVEEEKPPEVTSSVPDEKKRLEDALKRYKCVHCDYR